MKIAINCAFYQPKGGGIKEYIHNLLHNISFLNTDHEFIIYVLKDQIEFAKQNLPPNFRFKTIPFSSGSKINRIKRSLFEKRFWLREELNEKFDLFHSPFFHAPKFKNTKILLTVHDLRLYRFPETYEFFRYQFLKKKVKNSINKACHIISISEFTKKEIVELCGTNPDKITVVHEAINTDHFSEKNWIEPSDIPDVLKNNPFLLSVGHMEPRKNYDRLIDAFLKLKENPMRDKLKLVIVGKKDHSFKSTISKIESNPDVIYLNFVSTPTLLWLYKNASLFVFPSFYEGFGFPPLEAAALGTFSVVSNISSMPEICRNFVDYFNPFDVDDIKKTVEKALNNTQNDLLDKNNLEKLLNLYSWRKNAKETLDLYDKL